MTDRISSITVVLENDIRTDDAESLLNAISMLKGVISVAGNVSDFETHVATARAKRDIETRLLRALRDE